jgi:hypothetical protein
MDTDISIGLSQSSNMTMSTEQAQQLSVALGCIPLIWSLEL